MKDRRILDQRDAIVKELEKDTDPQALRERLAAMAGALQMTLCLPTTRKAVPHAAALEVLMRAVAHDIAGDPADRHYVREKLDFGYSCMLGELK